MNCQQVKNKMVGKRKSPDYIQICFYVPKHTGIEFKTECTKNELEQSDIISDLISAWLESKNSKTIDGNEFLKMLADKKRPTTGERACLADTLEIPVEILDRIIDCLFEEKKEKVNGI